MQLSVHGKQLDVGNALREHVSDKLEDINHKYFNQAIDATVTFAREGNSSFKTHIGIRIGKNIIIQATDTEGDPYAAFERAAEKVAKQMRRYKRKLRDHHERLEETPESEWLKARDYVIKNHEEFGHDDDEEVAANDDKWLDDEPILVAEMPTHIQTLTVSEAVMRMNLADKTAFMFKNSKTGHINMVYQREDGNIGWVDPAEA